jgi:hypothetical protein
MDEDQLAVNDSNIDDENGQGFLDVWEKEDSETLSSNAENGNKSSQLRIIRSNIDYNLDFLEQSIGKNIDLGPAFQRRSRWTISQKSLLIESLLMNLPIPPVFLFEKEYYNYEVIDGRQRLETIKEFLENKFRLQDLQYWLHFKDKLFKDLGLETQRMLLRRTISATVLLAESEGYDKADIRMILFDRLNTGGTKLNAQELRNAIFPGPFNDLILSLSTDPVFREIWGIPDPKNEENPRQKEKLEGKLHKNKMFRAMVDCELVLRFFAIREVLYTDINGSMRELLDKTIRKYQLADESQIQQMRELFISSLHGLYQIFGKNAFKNEQIARGGKARNLYDSLMVGYSIANIGELQSPEIIKHNLSIVLNNPTNYERIITKGNSLDNIRFRVSKAVEILNSIIS